MGFYLGSHFRCWDSDLPDIGIYIYIWVIGWLDLGWSTRFAHVMHRISVHSTWCGEAAYLLCCLHVVRCREKTVRSDLLLRFEVDVGTCVPKMRQFLSEDYHFDLFWGLQTELLPWNMVTIHMDIFTMNWNLQYVDIFAFFLGLFFAKPGFLFSQLWVCARFNDYTVTKLFLSASMPLR